jgi:hypothetical protein
MSDRQKAREEMRRRRSRCDLLPVVEEFGAAEILFQVGIDFSGEGGFSYHVDRWSVL